VHAALGVFVCKASKSPCGGFSLGGWLFTAAKWFSAFGPKASGENVLVRKDSEAVQLNRLKHLTSYVTGPDDGVASPGLFGGYPLRHLLNLNSVARSGARGVGLH
jgi:hypothetical protein